MKFTSLTIILGVGLALASCRSTTIGTVKANTPDVSDMARSRAVEILRSAADGRCILHTEELVKAGLTTLASGSGDGIVDTGNQVARFELTWVGSDHVRVTRTPSTLTAVPIGSDGLPSGPLETSNLSLDGSGQMGQAATDPVAGAPGLDPIPIVAVLQAIGSGTGIQSASVGTVVRGEATSNSARVYQLKVSTLALAHAAKPPDGRIWLELNQAGMADLDVAVAEPLNGVSTTKFTLPTLHRGAIGTVATEIVAGCRP